MHKEEFGWLYASTFATTMHELKLTASPLKNGDFLATPRFAKARLNKRRDIY